MKRRVVITGMGTVNAIANNVHSTWEGVKAGKNGIDHVTLFDISRQKPYLAGEVKDLHPEESIPPKEVRRMDRATLLAMVAAEECYRDSRLADADFDHDRFGVFVGSGIGGIWTIQEETRKAYERGVDSISPFFIPNAIVNLIGGNIAIRYQAKGAVIPVVTACSSATNSLGEAFRYIRDGYLELIMAGGAEAAVSEMAIGGFSRMRAITPSLDRERASIPFDKERSGFVVAEGAGILMLEEREHALKRKATIYAEILGYHSNCDAFHITQPDENAEGITKCMNNALVDADLAAEKIEYINPHGTSTFYNDRMESLAIRKVFGAHADKISIGATKSMHGHALGAVGGIETIITVMALEHGIIPPTINYRIPDPECDLDYTPNRAKARPIRYALKNSLGFGGHNATLILKKWEE